MLATALAVAPSLIKLLMSDDKKEATKELTNTVVNEAGKALGIKSNSVGKEDVIKHLEQNPQDAYKLKELESKHALAIKNLKLKEMELHLEDKKESVKVYEKDPETHKKLVWHINMQFYFSVIIGLVTLFATAYLVEDKGLAMAISAFVSSIITIVTNRVMTMDGFFFGSSIGSKDKDAQINLMKGKQ